MAIYRNVAILAAFVAGLLLVVALRFLQVVRQTRAGARRPRRAASKPSHRSKRHPCRLVVFLGSGGHTGEMLRLLCGLEFEQYAERVYLVSSGDALSLAKVAELEKARAAKPHTTPTTQPNWTVKEIPRARRVHQSFLTAPFTTLHSFGICLRLLTLPSLLRRHQSADVILLNGPGSCVPIALAAFLPRLVNLHSPQTVYIESLARVRRLSLSGRILRLFADRFFVQWEALADSTRAPPSTWLARKEYRGVLV